MNRITALLALTLLLLVSKLPAGTPTRMALFQTGDIGGLEERLLAGG